MTIYRTVESYISDLIWQLRVGNRARRRIAREVGDHRAELVAEEQARGLTPQAATRRATTRFGAPADLAAEFNRDVAVHGLRWAAWALVVCVSTAGAAAGAALQGWGPTAPWPNEAVFSVVTQLLAQVAGVCALNAWFLAVVAPWIRGVPLAGRPLRLTARSLVAATLALVPVAVVAAGNIGGTENRLGAALFACVVVCVPVAAFWALRAASRAEQLAEASQGSESTLAVIAACCPALVARWARADAAFEACTARWDRAVDRAPQVMCWFQLRRHPWRTALTVSVAAGIALKAPDLLLKGEVDVLAAGVEAAAVFVAYVLLGGLLGLRERTAA